jgi:hypothetical protein
MPDTRWSLRDVDQYLRASGRPLAPGSMALPLETRIVHTGADVQVVASGKEPTQPEKPPYWPYASKLERRYALYLDHLHHQRQVLRWEHEPFKLRLGAKCFYTPDFLVIWETQPRELYLMEVKGFWRDDARVKIKVAAEKHSYFHFIAVEWTEGHWKEERF